MCGFAGVIVWDEKYRVMPETLRRMSAAVAHRGPDGEGLRLTREHEPITPQSPQVALAFRRLAILDPDARSMQPFTDGRRWLVFNGEIYNYRELRAELTVLIPDYQWRTTGDTEVLLAAYAAWGEKCVEKLNGMFAFAVWDDELKRLFIARDQAGQKPLFVSCIESSGRCAMTPFATNDVVAIAFASELSALRPLPWLDTSVDTDEIAVFLALGYIPDGTVFKGARKMQLGTCAVVTAGTAHGRWYSLPYYSWRRPEGEHDAVRRTKELISTAVRRQLASDVPLGCFLSGGIDSAVIVASARAALGDAPIHTFTAGFSDLRYDERGAAAAMAKHLKTEHHEFEINQDAARVLPNLATVFGEPFGDSSALPTQYLSEKTRGFVKVALSGDGGDELFAGYDRYRALLLTSRLKRVPREAMLLGYLAAFAVPGWHPKSFGAKLRRMLKSSYLPAPERYAAFVEMFSPAQLAALLMRSPIPPATRFDGLPHIFRHISRTNKLVQTALAVDRYAYLPGDLLTKVDRCSMLHGLEVRSPFMDHELVQFAAGLTTDQLLKGGPKRMLREAFADDLPAWVFKRKKMGFAVPIGDWFRGPLRSMLRDTLFSSHAFGRTHFDMRVVERLVEEHESKRVDHSQRLYALLMLELWWNTVMSSV